MKKVKAAGELHLPFEYACLRTAILKTFSHFLKQIYIKFELLGVGGGTFLGTPLLTAKNVTCSYLTKANPRIKDKWFT